MEIHRMMITKEEFVIECIQDAGLLQEDEKALLDKFACTCLLLIYEERNQVQILFVSGSKQIRAVEMLEYMLSEFGLVRGEAGKASGVVSSAILRSQMSDNESVEIVEYFEKVIDEYIANTTCIVADVYASANENYIRQLPLYTKKKKKWAMVKSTDIVRAGEIFVIKSLENESGEQIVAQEDVYIMIGSRGEVYHIMAQKFENTYEITSEKLDVFAEMLDFIPEVQLVETGEYITIDDKAHICYPQRNVRIYAQPLQGRTKIFQGSGEGNYFLGRQGDYMAVREDDIRDIYIIQKEIFESTYEEAIGE